MQSCKYSLISINRSNNSMVTSKIMIKFDISISTILFEVFGLKN